MKPFFFSPRALAAQVLGLGAALTIALASSGPAHAQYLTPLVAPSGGQGGCHQNLSGTWQVDGYQSEPGDYGYSSTVYVSQRGSQLEIEQPDAEIVMRGTCRGRQLELRVFDLDGYDIGWTTGQIADGYRIDHVQWEVSSPEFMAGVETWYR